MMHLPDVLVQNRSFAIGHATEEGASRPIRGVCRNVVLDHAHRKHSRGPHSSHSARRHFLAGERHNAMVGTASANIHGAKVLASSKPYYCNSRNSFARPQNFWQQHENRMYPHLPRETVVHVGVFGGRASGTRSVQRAVAVETCPLVLSRKG